MLVTGTMRQFIKLVPNCKRMPSTKLSWDPCSIKCNVSIVCTFFVADSSSVSGFRIWSRHRKNGLPVSDSAEILRSCFTICWLNLKLKISQQRNFTIRTYFIFDGDFHKLFRIPQILLQIPQDRMLLETFE